MTRSSLLCVCLLLMGSASSAWATTINSDVLVDTTWDLAGSPYTMVGTITVVDSALLTIDPGVLIRCAGSAQLVVAGGLVARGTGVSQIRFEGWNPTPGYWKGLRFLPSSTPATYDVNDTYVSGSALEFVELVHTGVSADGGLQLVGATPWIRRLTLRAATEGGIRADFTGLTTGVRIEESFIHDIDGDGIALVGGVGHRVTDCVIHGFGDTFIFPEPGGISTYGAVGSVIIRNTVYDGETGVLDGPGSSGTLVEDNDFLATLDQGVFADSSVALQIVDNELSGGRFRDSPLVEIRNNQVTGHFRFDRCDDPVIQNNAFDLVRAGIELNYVNRSYIQGNSFVGAGPVAGNPAKPPFVEYFRSSGDSLIGNTFLLATGIGLQVDESTDVYLGDNSVEDGDDYGFFVLDSHSTVLHNNRFEGNETAGRLSGNTNTVVRQARFANNQNPLEVYGGTGLSFAGDQGNGVYNTVLDGLYYDNLSDLDASWVCWGTTDSMLIAAAIVDANDPGPILGGFVLFQPPVPCTGVLDAERPATPSPVLHWVTPNPFRGSASLRFHAVAAGSARLTLFSVSGRRVGDAVEGWVNEGVQDWPIGDPTLGTGVYFYRLELPGDPPRMGRLVKLSN